MRNIFRQLVIILAFLGILYGGLFALTYVLYPDNTINNEAPARCFFNFSNPPAQNVTLGLWDVVYPSPRRIFLMGASSAVRGFQPAVFQPLLPDFTISNVAVDSSHFRDLRNVFDVIRMTSPGSMKGTVIVIGLLYSEFLNSPKIAGAQHDPLTKVEAQALRTGFYRVKDHQLVPVFNARSMPFMINLLRPVFLGHRVFLNINNWYADCWVWVNKFRKKSGADTSVKGEIVLMREDKENTDEYMEGGEQEQNFLSLCRAVENSGASLVLVDMPSSQWFRDRAAFYKKYAVKKKIYLDQVLQLPRVQYIDLSGQFPDSDFVDSVHPTTIAAEGWSQSVAVFIRSRLNVLLP